VNHCTVIFAVLLGMLPLALSACDSRTEQIAALEKRIEEAVENGLHEWEAALHAPMRWERVKVERVKAVNGSIELAADGMIRTSNANGSGAEFAIELRPPRSGITAFRIEWAAGVGVEKIEIGEIEIRPDANAPLISIAIATANFEAHTGAVANAVDGNVATRWEVPFHKGKSTAAIFELKSPPKHEPQSSLLLTLRNQRMAARSVNFRVFVSTANPPILEVPDSIRTTMALEPSERSEEQRLEFEKYYRAHSKECAELQRELDRLKADAKPKFKASPE